VLIILVASLIGVFCIAGWLPGHIAKSRNHPFSHRAVCSDQLVRPVALGLQCWLRRANVHSASSRNLEED
jgi:hypothetical protein